MIARATTLFAALALVGGCSSSDATGPASQDGSAFDVAITGGTAPTYTWPGGTAHSVSVVRVSAPGTIVWGVANPVPGSARR